MFDPYVIGYLPGYSGDPRYGFTKKFHKKVSITFDAIGFDHHTDFKVLVQCEPPVLYRDFVGMVAGNHQNFDLILAYDERLLNYPQAVEFCPVGTWIDDIPLSKRNQITYLMSSKILSADHRMRFMILKRLGNLDRIGDFEFMMYRSPPRVESKNPFFTNAKFHIACENQVMNNMYTEKLLDCFKTLTVPIYYGCVNLGKYFNPRGILQFKSIQEFEKIIETLTPDKYDEMLPYVMENYELARPYWEKSIYQRIEDIVEKYLIQRFPL